MSVFRESIAKDYILAVQQGKIPDNSVLWQFGYTSTASTALETIWDGEGLYPYPLSRSVPSTVDLYSSSVADAGLEITIVGQDASGNEITENISLDVTNPTTTASTSTQSFSRVYMAWNNNGTNLTGDVTIYKNGSVLSNDLCAKILAAENQTLMSVFTIPLGYTGYLIRGNTNIGSGKEATIDFTIRVDGGVFRTQEKLAVYESVIEAERLFNPIPQLTDIEVRVKTGSAGTNVGATFGLLLSKN